MNGKTALVTGASGFIGSTLVERLTHLGFEVHALLRKSSSSANLKNLNYRRVDGDLQDSDSLCRAVEKVDYVFHLAGVTAAPNRAGYFEHNAAGSARIAEAVAKSSTGLKRFVYVSSLAAAGPAKALQPKIESDPSHPVSGYGESKLQGEVEILKFQSSFPISIVRPPMVYGPKDKGVFSVIKTVGRSFMPVMRGGADGGNKYYSSVHAQDLCQGVLDAAFCPADRVSSGEIFYITSDEISSYQDLMGTIARKLERNPVKIPVPQIALQGVAWGLTALGYLTGKTFPLNIDKLNEILPDYWICSNEKSKRVLGFQPKFDLSTGMADTIEWYKKNKWL